jgi:hypothetical protein
VLASLGQATARAFCPLATLVVLLQGIHLLVLLLHQLLSLCQSRLSLFEGLLLPLQSLLGLAEHLL